MSHFCLQISYTTAAWRRVVREPQDRFDLVRATAGSLGGAVHAVFFALDSYDVLAITEFPDRVSPSDISLAFFSSPDVAQVHTAQLLDAARALDAIRKAGPASAPPAPHPSLAASA